VTLPNGQTVRLPASTVAAIAQAAAKYAEPLWELREERVLKLGGHQWIEPGSVAAARAQWTRQPTGVTALAWKLFNRDWLGGAAACYADAARYPHHPRQWGAAVVPLVDEDGGAQQIGWARIGGATAMDHNFAVFVQFTILALFDPIPLPAEYM
jgi:hypothetical protein